MSKNWFPVLTVVLVGCGRLEDQAKPTGSILGKKTQDIKKHDPEAADAAKGAPAPKTPAGLDPISTPIQVGFDALDQLVIAQIDHALNLYQATNGHYPKNYEEFMQKVIKDNQIQLPVLRTNLEYQYDEKAHKLLIVEKKK